MQNFNQTEAPITYQNYPTTSLGQGPACPESAISYEMNGSSTNEESLATLENTSSYQNDSNSALFSGESSFGMQNSSFTYNEKYSNSFGSAGQPVTDDISQTSMGSSGSVPYEDYRPQAMLKINAQQSNQLALKGDEQPPTMPMLQSPNQASLQSPLTQSPGNNSPCSKSQSFSSPSTPAKPKSSKKKSENIKKLYALDNAEGRKEFLDQLTSFNEQKKIPMTQCPTVAKCIIDLFKVYQLVKERGGFIDVSRAAKWKEIAETCQITSTSTTAYSLRKQYGKYLLPFECHFEYGDGRDPEALYKKIEEEMKSTKKSSSSSKSKSNASNNANQSQIVQMPSSYPPSTATQQRAKQQLAIQQPGMQQQQQAMQQPGIQQQGIQQSNMPPQPNMQQQQSMPPQQGMQPQGMQSQQQAMQQNIQQNIQQPPAFANYSKQQANQMVKSTIYNNQVIYETSMVPFDQNAHHQLSKSAYIDDQNYVNSQMSGQMSGQMNNQINSQMNSQMSGQISGQNHQLSNQMNSQMNNQMTNQISNQMNNQMNSQMNNQMTNQMTSQMTSQMTNQMNSPMNQMSGNDSMNYDNLYQPNQQVLGQEYTAQQAQQAQQAYYNQQSFETEGASNFHANNQVLQKSTAVSMQQQQQYYADSGNQYNGANYANNYGDQYSSYAYSDTGLYTDTSRMPVNRSMPNEQSYSSKPYQFTTTSVAAYDYAPQQQPNRANSQANYSSSSTVVQYQPPIGRVQQSASQQCTQQQQQFMLEGSNLDMSMHHQTNPIPDNWPMGNGNLSNNWSPNVQQNCMQMQYQQHQQHQQHQQQPMNAQQLSIESQIQKPQSQQLALPQQQQIANLIHRQATQTSNASYFSGQAFSTRHYPHHSAHPHAMHHPHHQVAAAFSPASSSLHPMHHHQQAPQTNLSPKNFLGRDTHFPSDCIEGVKPNLEPRRKLTAKDLQPPDAAKLIMGLKSGQLVEFTQSLNQLLILSSEDPIFKEIKLAKNRGLQKQVITHFHELLVKLFPQLFAFETGKSEPAKPDLNNNQTDEAKLDEIIPFCNGNNTELSEEDKRVVSQFISNDNRLIVDQRAVKAEKTYVITSMFPEKEYDRKSFDEPLSNDRSMNGFCEDQYEPEVKPEEVSPLHTISQHKEDSNQRCIAMSTLVRNLSFLKGNDEVFSNDDELLSIFGKIILFDHNHNEKRARACQESASITNGDNGKSSREAWWFEALKMIQGNALVTLANMSGHLNFEKKDEKIILPILEGLLHWATCPSLIALDAFESSTSRKRLAIECLVKMSVYESNVDLLLATPTFRKRSQQIFSMFIGLLGKDQPQIMREFALVILSNLSKSDRNVAAAVCAASGGIVENLVRTLEQYKENLEAAQSGVNPVIGQAEGITTLNMAKRAAACLHDLAKVPENCQYFAPKQQRLVQLITWGHFDNDVSLMLHDIVYELLEAPRPPSAADSTDSPMETGGYIVR